MKEKEKHRHQESAEHTLVPCQAKTQKCLMNSRKKSRNVSCHDSTAKSLWANEKLRGHHKLHLIQSRSMEHRNQAPTNLQEILEGCQKCASNANPEGRQRAQTRETKERQARKKTKQAKKKDEAHRASKGGDQNTQQAKKRKGT